jgi:serine/threonine protein kinase
MSPADSWVRIRLPRGEWFYDSGRPLGPPGGFGEVFEGKNEAGQPVAVKRLKVSVGAAAHRELKIADELAVSHSSMSWLCSTRAKTPKAEVILS